MIGGENDATLNSINRKKPSENDIPAESPVDIETVTSKGVRHLLKRKPSLIRYVLALDVEKFIGTKIVGQRGPLFSVSSAIRMRENGWVEPRKPLVMLFLGGSGVGKTELAKQLALYLHGRDGLDAADENAIAARLDTKLVRLDMGEFRHSYTLTNLTGKDSLFCECACI